MSTLPKTWSMLKYAGFVFREARLRNFSNGVPAVSRTLRKPSSVFWEPVRLVYEVTEPTIKNEDDLTPIILLHGMTMSKESWRDVVKPLAEATNRKVYTYDAREHGDNSWTNAFYIEHLKDDFKHQLDVLGLDKVIAIGHCIGGWAAMDLALTEPERIQKLFIEDVSPRGVSHSMCYKFNEYMKLLLKSLDLVTPSTDIKTAKRIISEFMDNCLLPANASREDRRLFESSLPLQQTTDGYRWKTNLELLIANYYDMLKVITDPLQGRYDGDVLFMCCTKSPYKVLEDKEMIMQRFPRAKFKVIEGSTHRIHLRYPKDFLKTATDFINSSSDGNIGKNIFIKENIFSEATIG